jgi:hypothetical protein
MEISMRSKYIVLSVALSVSVMSVAWSADEPAPPAAATAQPAATPAATRAAQPAAQAAPAAQSAASSTANEAATKAPAKATATATATAASDTKSTPDAQEKRILAAGYKKKTQNGQTFYCRKETPIGSRFESERCETAEEMAMRAQQGKDFIKSTTAVAGSRN